MAEYARVKCEECGLLLPQNEAISEVVDSNLATAVNDISFGLSGSRLRLWKQGSRHYTHPKRIFLCPNCHQAYRADVIDAAKAVEARESQAQTSGGFWAFLKMLFFGFLWTLARGMWAAITSAPKYTGQRRHSALFNAAIRQAEAQSRRTLERAKRVRWK
jgi:hypothetical protein